MAPPATSLTPARESARESARHRSGTEPSRLPAKVFAPGLHLFELPASPGPIGALVDERAGTAAALLRVQGRFVLPARRRRQGAQTGCLGGGPRVSLEPPQFACAAAMVPARLARGQRQPTRPSQRGRRCRQPGVRRPRRLARGVGAKSWRHETLLLVAVRCRARSRGRRGARLSDEDADAVRNEVRSLRAQMRNVGLVCEGVLDQAGAAVALGDFLVPGLDRHPGAHPWPLALEEHWADVRADGSWHRTYWVAEWPRSSVGPDFLSPLLIGTGRRSFSVVMAPVPPERAERDAQSSRTAQVADAQLRAQGGFLETARQRRQAEAVEGREERLVDGRGVFKLSGYFTVSGSDKADPGGGVLRPGAGGGRRQGLSPPAVRAAEGGPYMGAPVWEGPRRPVCDTERASHRPIAPARSSCARSTRSSCPRTSGWMAVTSAVRHRGASFVSTRGSVTPRAN